MTREEMKQIVKEILLEVKHNEASVEDASEAILKVFEKSLEESVSEAVKRLPGLGKLLKGVEK